MIITPSVITQFVAVLLATLIGVYLAFRLDRFRQEQQTRRRAINHLRSIRTELKLNEQRLNANRQLIKHLQNRDPEGDHYILESLETAAWIAALEEPIVGTVSNDVYEPLQDTYSSINSINSLIDRQKDEMHHPVIGSEGKFGHKTYEIWTMSVDYFDHESEEVDYTGLGPLIKNRSRSLRYKDGLIEKLNNEIERLENYTLGQHLFRS